LALGVIEPVLFDERAREHDARLFVRRRAREYGAREFFGARRSLRELRARLLYWLFGVGPGGYNVVRVVDLRVEFFWVNFDAHDLRCCPELRLAEVLRGDVRRGGQALARLRYRLNSNVNIERARVAQVRDPRARALYGQPDPHVR